MKNYRYEYIISNGTRLFTAILLPEETGKFPVVLIRVPYVDYFENTDEEDIVLSYMNDYSKWLRNGYAIIIQHCRGRGKSDGDCIPYINEREDGLALQAWVRNQDFYNGEIFLKGRSYCSSVHYATAPFAEDIKGAVFGAQDCERYNICYRNGFFKIGLHGDWYTGMYKKKSHIKQNYTRKTFNTLPLSDFTKIVFGEPVEDFDRLLKSPNRDNEFWNTRFGGSDARDAVKDVNFPILFTTSFYDLYTGGVFDMWNGLDTKTRSMAALVVSPYDHGDWCDEENSIVFTDVDGNRNGRITEKFGDDYEIEWFNHIRNSKNKSPVEAGKITYYRLFENVWKTDEFKESPDDMEIKLGTDEVTYVYNPYDAPEFKGGLSCNFDGAVFQDKPYLRNDIITVYTKPFEKDIFVKGKMYAKLKVKSDCEDTCFYMRISITKEQGDFGLRDDITSLCYQLGDYTPNSEVLIDFNFDEHSFLIKKGEKLRIDIASANANYYVRHTNNKGLYSEQTTAKIANNTVFLQDSILTLPIE